VGGRPRPAGPHRLRQSRLRPQGSDYIKGTLHAFGGTQAANGSIFGHIQNWTVWPPTGGFYSTSYSMYHVLSVASYYLYSGDIDFAQAQYQIIKNQLAYNRSLVDPELGLLITGAGGEGVTGTSTTVASRAP
jgi:hypothetical protein